MDIHDLDDVWWAYLNRGSIHDRTMLLTNIPGGYEYNENTLQFGRLGIDATAPYGDLHKFERSNTPGESEINLSEYISK